MNESIIKLLMPEQNFETGEAIKMLRGNIQMSGYGFKAVSITSAAPNEGKSYIAFQLAKSLADLGKRTVYLDCDIRNSNIKKEYKIQSKTFGLSEYLCGLCAEKELVYPTTFENFHIVFSGRKAPNPSELLSGELFSHLLENLKKEFDYVILDTPPVNVVVDAIIVSKQADTTILVVKGMATEKADAIQMKKKLEAANIHLLGVVMNMYDTQNSSYGKYGYGKYGYGKYGYGKYGYGKYGYGKYGYGQDKNEKNKTDR